MKYKVMLTLFSSLFFSVYTSADTSSGFSERLGGEYSLVKKNGPESEGCSKSLKVETLNNQSTLNIEFSESEERPDHTANYEFENSCPTYSPTDKYHDEPCIRSSEYNYKTSQIDTDSFEIEHEYSYEISLKNWSKNKLVITKSMTAEMFLLRLLDEKDTVCTYERID